MSNKEKNLLLYIIYSLLVFMIAMMSSQLLFDRGYYTVTVIVMLIGTVPGIIIVIALFYFIKIRFSGLGKEFKNK